MPRDADSVLLESVATRRARLRAAFLHGDIRGRRTTADNVRRFVGSIVIAAVACAACAGYSFVQKVGPLRPSTTQVTQSPAPPPTDDALLTGTAPADDATAPADPSQTDPTEGSTP